MKIKIKKPNVNVNENEIISKYVYQKDNVIKNNQDEFEVNSINLEYTFKTNKKVPKLGVLVIGIGGNNGTTLIGGVIANREKIKWKTRKGMQEPNYYGSYTQATCIDLGDGHYIPFNKILPMVNPDDIVFGGWDLNKKNLADAMKDAKVLEPDLVEKLTPFMQKIVPMPSVFLPDYIAKNQMLRADNCLHGNLSEMLETLRTQMREFKTKNQVDKIIVFWSGNTECFSEVETGINDTASNLLEAIKENSPNISPSTLYAVAAVLEGYPYINGSPQNTFVPGLIELAEQKGVTIAGDDLKTGQTRYKSVMVDFLVSIGIKPMSIVSYNHLGNNDGKNLSEEQQFKSKEISKSSVIDDVIHSNPSLYKNHEKPDHTIVIKYVPYAGDRKRAIDEYVSEIFLGYNNEISVLNICEDSLLAAPIILDLIVLAELIDRIEWKTPGMDAFARFHPINSFLSLFLKAPLYSKKSQVINVFYKQRLCIENLMRVCAGLSPQDFLFLEQRCVYKEDKSACCK